MLARVFPGLLAMLLILVAGGEAVAVGGAVVGQPPPAFSLKDETGKVVTWENFRGKPTIIYFTHNACWYCTQVAGFFVRMEEKLGAGSFQVVGINVMAKDQRLVKAYKREVGFRYPMLAGNTSELLKAYRINYVPVLIFVGRDGIVKRVVGHYIMETELEAAIAEIAKGGK
ncbi:MAG: hypothetical protein A2V83_11370 [Nitrospirae bacterium RBG_16_64_22]|nr:MAG: hypothetical protein A2V83_11370 [Nitrospirae bacterium RBG_16_64_22]